MSKYWIHFQKKNQMQLSSSTSLKELVVVTITYPNTPQYTLHPIVGGITGFSLFVQPLYILFSFLKLISECVPIGHLFYKSFELFLVSETQVVTLNKKYIQNPLFSKPLLVRMLCASDKTHNCSTQIQLLRNTGQSLQIFFY